jgi:hypothetical protein
MRLAHLACVAAIMAPGISAGAQPNAIDSIRTPQTSALTDFWTDNRRQDAKAMPVPVLDPSTLEPIPAEPKAGSPRTGRAGNGGSSALARAIGNVTTRPLYWAGKLYFNTDEGSMVCSAQFIAPGILATASHCVQDGKSGRWYSQFLYRHQNYMDTGRDFSTECIAAYKGWVSSERSHWTWDFAMVKLRGGDDLGHFGWQYNWWGTYDEVPKIGYPVAVSNGKVIQVDFGKLMKGWDPKVIGLKHDNPSNAEGSSGGAWIGHYETGGSSTQSNFVISITSHHLGQDRSISYGPYWDDNFGELLKYTQRGCK